MWNVLILVLRQLPVLVRPNPSFCSVRANYVLLFRVTMPMTIRSGPLHYYGEEWRRHAAACCFSLSMSWGRSPHVTVLPLHANSSSPPPPTAHLLSLLRVLAGLCRSRSPEPTARELINLNSATPLRLCQSTTKACCESFGSHIN